MKQERGARESMMGGTMQGGVTDGCSDARGLPEGVGR